MYRRGHLKTTSAVFPIHYRDCDGPPSSNLSRHSFITNPKYFYTSGETSLSLSVGATSTHFWRNSQRNDDQQLRAGSESYYTVCSYRATSPTVCEFIDYTECCEVGFFLPRAGLEADWVRAERFFIILHRNCDKCSHTTTASSTQLRNKNFIISNLD